MKDEEREREREDDVMPVLFILAVFHVVYVNGPASPDWGPGPPESGDCLARSGGTWTCQQECTQSS